MLNTKTMAKKGFLTVMLIGAALSFTSCKHKDKDDSVDFDKRPIMENLADNYIIPGYTDLSDKVNALETAWNTFLSDPSQANLELTQNAWFNANISFQHVKAFDFGPAMTSGLLSAYGTFPADTVQITNNISSGSYDLQTADNIDAVGFDALDFLLYRSNALSVIQASVNMQTYISDLIAKMKTEISNVTSNWQSYRGTFVDGTSTASTAPFALLVNTFCRDFELSKTTKVGIPIGTQSLGIQQPVYLESRRSGKGKELLIASMEASRSIFSGLSLSNGANGSGFDDYLTALEKTSLSSTIQSRLDYLAATPATWNENIEGLMGSNPQILTDYYNYMQSTVVSMKTDMASAFGVLITYQDNDGD